ncbi:MAG: hypothetical protein Q4E39_05865 [bacterium]|uniref:hypothetical protein n=1 Tax=Clostridium baratii TaxID=1561 RepID=UPI0005F2B315|nr:hypothetical protein [Clostridium baratii]AQM58574.1 hypothetical protein NPD11_3078 [Clostridium baratii]KJU70942.1 hypothetical protein UC77_12280 [Clostridium baratii]MDO5003730.1 hypothetical protein [bacterium]
MGDLQSQVVNFTKNFISVNKEPIYVIGIIIAVGVLVYAAIRLMMTKNANERSNVLHNILYVVIGLILLALIFTIAGLLFNLFK